MRQLLQSYRLVPGAWCLCSPALRVGNIKARTDCTDNGIISNATVDFSVEIPSSFFKGRAMPHNFGFGKYLLAMS
jgi:hypothetical protein